VTYEFSVQSIGSFLLAVGRVGGLVTFAPFFSNGAVAVPVRILLATAMVFGLGPVLEGVYPAIPIDLFGFTLAMIREFLVGCILGLAARLVFSALDVAGQVMSYQTGFGFIHMVDPETQVETPFFSILLNLIALLAFLQINGHHWLIEAVLKSYTAGIWAPSVDGPLVTNLINGLQDAFVAGFRIAAPLVVMMFVVDVLLGVLGRTAPQIHILVVGMSGKLLLSFLLLALTGHSLVPQVAAHISRIAPDLERYLMLLRP